MQKLINEFNLYKTLFQKELHDNILTFWIKYGIEKDGHGLYGAVDLKGIPVPDAPKSCVLNARILWTYAEAAQKFNDQLYTGIADRAYRVLKNDFADKKYGGYFMSIDAENQPLDTIKHTYVQAFVLYSLSKYYELRATPEILQETEDYFNFLEDKTKDAYKPGYLEAFTSNWKPFSENRMTDNNEPRSMNTHLHILEAYAAFYKISKDELAGRRLKELLLLFIRKGKTHQGFINLTGFYFR